MNVMQKSEAIKAGLRKGFQDGSSKMARRKCYGYEVGPDGELAVNPDEAQVVCWIFGRYLAGHSLGKIAAGLEKQVILSPTGRPRWNREAIDKLLSNEKYTGRVMLQKTISTGAVQIENDGLTERYLYTGSHEAIISDEMFIAVQQEKLKRTRDPEKTIAMSFAF
ncbi:MAG: hypothetical protein HFF77_12290 [Oscillospiraceae bacterium]|jgi:hypothetical protein|nr:hypothetical protein [Oscillospiraceae bacterium]